MSHSCKRCGKNFQYSYLLQRHLHRKKKCEINENVLDLEKNIEIITNELEDTKIAVDNLTKKVNDHCENTLNKLKCRFCDRNFSIRGNLLKHIKICKFSLDNIYIYERELNIHPENPSKNLNCRYCEQSFTNKSSYSRHMTKGCKAKDDYEKELKEQVLDNRRQIAEQTINNTTNNNTTNNNIHIHLPQMRAFGNENLDYITTKLLIKELEQFKENSQINNLISKFTEIIHANPAHPENQNVLMNSVNAHWSKVFNGYVYENRQSEDVQDQILQNISTLVQRKTDDCFRKQIEGVSDIMDELDEKLTHEVDNIDGAYKSKKLVQYRNGVKHALFNNKNQIETTIQIIDENDN